MATWYEELRAKWAGVRVGTGKKLQGRSVVGRREEGHRRKYRVAAFEKNTQGCIYRREPSRHNIIMNHHKISGKR